MQTRRNRILLFLLILGICGIIFTAYPEIDLWTAGLFYNDEERFYLRNHWLAQGFYHGTRTLSAVIIVGILVGGAALLVSPERFTKKRKKRLAYLFLALVIGPGLLVNSAFKNQWGRARPHQVEQFGGDKTFTPALQPTDQCVKNCSFVAGHPAMGFYFFALAFAFRKYRRQCNYAAFALGGTIGLTRIVQGGHFFSDVIFSGFTVYITCWVLYRLILARK